MTRDHAAGGSRTSIRTLIVDDSVVVRRVIERILAADPAFTVLDNLSTAERALDFVRAQPVDLVLLDVEMPGRSGVDVLPELLAAQRGLRVVILSSAFTEGSKAALEALALGASDMIAKPGAGHFGAAFPERLVDRLKRLMGLIDCAASAADLAPASGCAGAPATSALRPHGTQLRAIGIGASTGGILALTQLFGAWRTMLGVPIFVTQHLPPSFIDFFADQVRRMSPMTVSVARDGDLVRPNHIHVAPGTAHLTLEANGRGNAIVRLSGEATAHGAFPSVDPMFSALARVYGNGACGIILSGMGRDGTFGARDIVAGGGWMIAQDDESSTVWGMPGSVVRVGLASAVLHPAEMPRLFTDRVQEAA
jgi:two-component system chemotaxis response regulator CheB